MNQFDDTVKRFLDHFDGEERKAKQFTVSFPNEPSTKQSRILFESAFETDESAVEILEEAKWKKWDNDHEILLHRRPANQGGNQLHIRGRKGQEWAYRFTGGRSEPRKYDLRSTNTIKDIVSSTFNIPRDQVAEAIITNHDAATLFVEILFA